MVEPQGRNVWCPLLNLISYPRCRCSALRQHSRSGRLDTRLFQDPKSQSRRSPNLLPQSSRSPRCRAPGRVFFAVGPRHLALAAAEDSALEAQLIERFAGCDRELLSVANALVSESGGNYPNGPLFWNELAGAFINGLVARHMSRPQLQIRGTLGKEVMARLRDYIVSNIGEPIEVAALAKIAGRSPFHFSRVFSRSVGVSPHRYIVHLRLQRALELVRGGQDGLAEIAVRSGFSDQSHLWRWVRRVHGVSLTQLATPPASEQHESS